MSKNTAARNTPWSRIEATRREVSRRYPSVWKLPLRRRWSDVLLEATEGCRSILDLGAGDRRVEALLHQRDPGLDYRSLDIDDGGTHDYRSFDEVDRSFDAACGLEWIEHLELSEAEAAIRSLAGHLGAGGVLVLTTPNTFYPPAYLRDSTHRTPFCYDELGGLLLRCGFELTGMFRLYHAPFAWKILRRGLLAPLHRALGIDFARQIAVVGRKRPEGSA